MIIRTLAFAGGLCGAAALSQFPEFTQQYIQRLAGQVEALETVIADFDASATRSEMTRDEALAAMGGTAFLEARRADMRATIAREGRLSLHLEALRGASPVERLLMPHRVADTRLASATFSDFTPAVPLSLAGALSSVAGFAFGWLLVRGALHFLCWPFRRRQRRRSGLSFTQ